MIAKLAAILAILSILCSGIYWYDSRLAKSADLQAEIAQRKALDKSVGILSTGITRDAKQSRLWALEDRYKTRDPTQIPDQDKRQEMRQLQMDLPLLNERMKTL
jgi:hypothetical protein